MKKFIKHELPVDNYEIINTYSLSADNYITCDNCGKVIKNIAVIKNSKGQTFNVGLDCAETLSGIDDYDIAYWSNNFNIAKSIRAKVRKFQKQGGILRVQNSYWDLNNVNIELLRKLEPERSGDYFMREELTFDFIKKYLPEFSKMAKVNTHFTPVPKSDYVLFKNGKFGGYTFKYELKNNKKYNFIYAYAEIWKDGQLISCASNGGRDEKSCLIECVNLYNKVSFENGLIPLV